jgi:hypothetical protein
MVTVIFLSKIIVLYFTNNLDNIIIIHIIIVQTASLFIYALFKFGHSCK